MTEESQSLAKAPRIRLHLNVHEPVELVELTLAFQGLGYEYQSFVKAQALPNGDKNKNHDVKLYITKLETNCILAEMAPALPLFGTLAPVFSDVNTVADFIRNIGQLVDWLRSIKKRMT
jgi:hypothetical protein